MGESSIRAAYERSGAGDYYRRHGADYRNPHEARVAAVVREAVRRSVLDLGQVLDLACGSGEVTRALRALGCASVTGIDPYTGAAFERAAGLCAQEYSFQDIARGALHGRQYSLVACSYALHLLEESWLPVLCRQLSLIAPALLVVTPHKRPVLREEWGWTQIDELVIDRARGRTYIRHEVVRP